MLILCSVKYVKNVEHYTHIIDWWPLSLPDPAPTLAAKSRSTSRDRCVASLGQAERTFLQHVVSRLAVCPVAPKRPAGRSWILDPWSPSGCWRVRHSASRRVPNSAYQLASIYLNEMKQHPPNGFIREAA